MLWLILLSIFVLGCFLIFRSKTRGYKILGYVIVGCSLAFSIVVVSSMGVKTDNIIEYEPTIITD